MLAVLAKAQDLSGRQVTQSTCAPLLGAWRSSQPARHEAMCLDYQKGIVAFLKANPKLKLAVLSGNWASYQKGMGSNALGLDGTGAKSPTRPAIPWSRCSTRPSAICMSAASPC